jgi:hypothetical protein
MIGALVRVTALVIYKRSRYDFSIKLPRDPKLKPLADRLY